MLVDNHDSRIQYFPLKLEKNANEPIEEIPLPKGFHYVFFKPGDEEAWISIEFSAGELKSREQGHEIFQLYFGQNKHELSQRMVFVVNSDGDKVATASAWWDIHSVNHEKDGWLHWVAVQKEWQGFHLSKPLVTHVMRIIQGFGVERLIVPTQTTTWVACKLYLDLGFRPIEDSLDHSMTGWGIIRSLTGHPSLAGVQKATVHEIFPDIFPDIKEEKQEHSCGAVVFGFSREHELLFLLIQSCKGEWGFPKGHVETNESDLEAALREIREETGITVNVLHGFRRESVYPHGNSGKRVTYFLAIGDPSIRPVVHDVKEVRQAVWCTLEESRARIRMEDRRIIFEEAVDFLQTHRVI